MRQRGFVLLPVIILIVLIGVVGYFVYQNSLLRMNGGKPVSPSSFPTIITTTNLPKPIQTSNPIANWKTFNSPTLGVEFKFPTKLEKYGVLKETISPAEKGTYLCITFPSKSGFVVKDVFAGGAGCNLNNFGLEANSVGFEAGRSGNFTDIQGFEYKNGIAYYNWSVGTEWEKQGEIPNDIVTKVSDDIIKIKGKSYSEMSVWPLEGIVGAIINTGNATYPGLVITASLKDGLTESEFDQILSTFKFTE
jgi:hypothetical protein